MQGHWPCPTPGYIIWQHSLQHIARVLQADQVEVEGREDSTTVLMGHVTGTRDVDMGLEALAYAKINKQFPTFVLIQKIWNKTRQLQNVTGFTNYSPIWDNKYYPELLPLDSVPRWKKYRIARLKHIFCNSTLSPFADLHFAVLRAWAYVSLWHVTDCLNFAMLFLDLDFSIKRILDLK